MHPGDGGDRRQPGIVADSRDLQALDDEGPVEAGQRHHVADGAEGDQVQPAAQDPARAASHTIRGAAPG